MMFSGELGQATSLFIEVERECSHCFFSANSDVGSAIFSTETISNSRDHQYLNFA